jgi:hypothetical protein
MWNSGEHSDEENIRWSWLRAVEWLEWPLFISQPVVPVLLYFYRWPAVLGGVVAVAFLWRALVTPFWVVPSLANIGPFFVKLKFVSAPAMAYLLWQRGDMPGVVVAALFPILGTIVASLVMIPPLALLSLTPFGKASQIGLVQVRFLSAIGFQPRERDLLPPLIKRSYQTTIERFGEGHSPMEGIGIYTLDKPITEFQAQELIKFSEFNYDHLLKTYGIRRLFPNEVFYTATDKAFLGYEATEAVVAALHGLIYKVYFNFIQASAEKCEGLREEISAYVADRYGEPTEVRDLPNGMRVAIWDRDFGNVIIESDYMHTALVFTSRNIEESTIRPKKRRSFFGQDI